MADIDDSQKTREDLREELRMLREELRTLRDASARTQSINEDLFKLIGDSILILDSATGKIIDLNPQAARRLGYTVDELIGHHIGDIEQDIPEDLGPASSWMSTYTQTQVFEKIHIRKDGSTFPVEISCRLAQDGDDILLLYVVRDISVRKALEKKLQELVEEAEAYAHTVAHDIKNPIAVIHGFCALLISEAEEHTPEDLERSHRTMYSMSGKLTSIVEELLLMSTLRSDADYEVEAVDMRAVLENVVMRLQGDVDDRQAQIVADPGSWPPVAGRTAWVEEVLVNYVSNAIKYGGTPPVVEIGVELIAAPGVPQGMTRVWVKDNGPGIPVDQQQAIFDKFTRLDRMKAQGHGLGLSIVKRLVHKMNGEVGVRSQPGEGSVFSFSLPVAADNEGGDLPDVFV